MRSLGRFELDARNSTEFGLLRAYTRIDFARRTGSLRSGTGARQATAIDGSIAGVDFNGNAQTQVVVDRAFIQLGGLTAGRAVSFFGFYNGDYDWVGVALGDGLVTNLAAYTVTFGSGFSATLSLEDPIERRQLIVGQGTTNNFINSNAIVSQSAGVLTGPTGTGYAGAAMPEIVANLRVDQSWGSAQLSGALHQLRVAGSSATPGSGAGTEYGYAFNAGVKVNLPMIAAGDNLMINFGYANGAVNYVANNIGQGAATAGQGKVGNLALVDGIVTNTGQLETTQIYGLTVGVQHYWTPKIVQALYGSYGQVAYSSAAVAAMGGSANNTAGQANGFRNWQYWAIGSNVSWTPVKGLLMGVELDYQNTMTDGGDIVASLAGPRQVGALASTGGAITTRLRIQRDF